MILTEIQNRMVGKDSPSAKVTKTGRKCQRFNDNNKNGKTLKERNMKIEMNRKKTWQNSMKTYSNTDREKQTKT